MPSRSRTDEDRYRKSKYKPVRIEDSPVFWKDKADRCYKVRDWRGAVEAYSEAIKRDGSFMAAVSNRAATYIHTGEYDSAINDCELALNILANTPASDTTQDAYRRSLIRLHTRRGAAYCWNGEVEKGLSDYRLAAAYKDPEQDQDLVEDLEVIMAHMKAKGLIEFDDPRANKRSDAGQLYFKGNYAGAVTMYQELLSSNEFDVKSRSNLCATYLQQGAFQPALEEAKKLIDFCAEVATALNQPGAQGSAMEDSDDEDADCEDPIVAQKLEAARTIQEKSGHVYLLLKSYVRAGAALCGLKDMKGGYEMLERALRITPYDDDLRDDANRILEKLRMETLISATTGSSSSAGGGKKKADVDGSVAASAPAPPANLPAAVEGALKKPSDSSNNTSSTDAPKKKKRVTLGLTDDD
jgi:dyslexia susceptibility 1 candidate gene 1 protein